MDLRILKELGEWACLGIYEGIDGGLPWPVYLGRGYRRMYENMDVRVPENKLLIPCEPLFESRNMRTDNLWFAESSMIVDINHTDGLRVNLKNAEAKKVKFPERAGFIDKLICDMRAKLPHHGGYTHSNPDIRRVVAEGFELMEKELDDELEKARSEAPENPSGLNFLLSLKEYTAGVRAFYNKTAAALGKTASAASGKRAVKLKKISAAFSNCFMKKSETFLEGLLAVNFTWMLDCCDSIGRFDQALGPLFERDIREKKLDIEFARELLDELWQSFEDLNGWNLQLGGRTPDGKDGCSLLTKECVAACARNKFRRPNAALRITADTSDSIFADALRALGEGSGRPALYNDDLYIETLKNMDLGLTIEDAREIGFGGCTETMIAGMSNVGSLEGTVNLAQAATFALNDGRDPLTGATRGPRTGKFEDFKSFDSFMAALKRQILYITDGFVCQSRASLKKRFTEGDPKFARSFFTRDCVKNRKSFEAGGARYNWAVVCYQGIADMINSAAAVKKTVFDDKSVTAAELTDALKNDFEDCPKVLSKLLAAPKYGNDDDYADLIGKELMEFAWGELCKHETPRGGRHIGSCIIFTTNLGAGSEVGALPSGRKAREPLADSVGPSPGTDTLGPTALLKSVAKLPLTLAAGTPVLNLRFAKSVFDDERSLKKVIKLLRSFFKQGGLQVQVSVLSAEEMLDAQKNPDKHKDLIVRIGGYSEYFNRLAPGLQDQVIKRTVLEM
jgi:formate C-acetyltransferase